MKNDKKKKLKTTSAELNKPFVGAKSKTEKDREFKKIFDLDKMKKHIEHSAKPSSQAKRPRKSYKEYKKQRDKSDAVHNKDAADYEKEQRVHKKVLKSMSPREQHIIKSGKDAEKLRKLELKLKRMKGHTKKPKLA